MFPAKRVGEAAACRGRLEILGAAGALPTLAPPLPLAPNRQKF
jgi:hypothetical protein